MAAFDDGGGGVVLAGRIARVTPGTGRAEGRLVTLSVDGDGGPSDVECWGAGPAGKAASLRAGDFAVIRAERRNGSLSARSVRKSGLYGTGGGSVLCGRAQAIREVGKGRAQVTVPVAVPAAEGWETRWMRVACAPGVSEEVFGKVMPADSVAFRGTQDGDAAFRADSLILFPEPFPGEEEKEEKEGRERRKP